LVDRKLITAKLVELADRVARARAHEKASARELAADRDALDLVAFNLMLAVQSCVDLASHLIADEGWLPAGTLAEGFVRLSDHGVISPSTRDALVRAVGLRNVVAHGYAGVDPALVHAAVTTGTYDLDAFAREVAAWLAARS
jgi:uncharacterized protein YutE (UPF0331/DUF86 family)